MGLENPLHIAIIVVVILLVFGAKRLPEMGRSLGEGMRGFKDSVTGGGTPEVLPPPPPPPTPPPAPVAAEPVAPPPAAAPAPVPAPAPAPEPR